MLTFLYNKSQHFRLILGFYIYFLSLHAYCLNDLFYLYQTKSQSRPILSWLEWVDYPIPLVRSVAQVAFNQVYKPSVYLLNIASFDISSNPSLCRTDDLYMGIQISPWARISSNYSKLILLSRKPILGEHVLLYVPLVSLDFNIV